MKVYELAKKLEVKSVFLMDKIRKDWKLPVKTHMEALSPDMVKKIEERFYSSQKKQTKKQTKKKTSSKKSPAKAKGLKKKTSATKSSSKSKELKKKTITRKSDTAKKVTKTVIKKETLESPTPPEKLETSAPVQKAKQQIIIRRKADEKKVSEKSSTTSSSSSQQQESASPATESKRFAEKSIRMDLVSVKSTDPLDSSFWDKEEEELEVKKKVPKKPIAEKDVSSKFNATDFRKREVIFQPRKKRTAQTGESKSTPLTTPKSHKRVLKIHGEMSTEKLCQKMGLKKQVLIRKLKEEGVEAQSHSVLDFDTIALIVPSFGFEAKNTKHTEKEILEKLETEKKQIATAVKPPVITIMGHVDHGKTTLLDFIRKSKLTQGEAGGITQQIGAYSVTKDGKSITFIDTPGHSAFTAMRSRGARATDIVVLIVAADDGVQPQTIEALNHAKAAKTPIIVAISKMDAPGANPDKIKQQMSEQGIVPEDWGGDTGFIPISALKGEGIKELLEQIQLTAEMQELKCHPTAPAKGVVLEARKEKGLGCVVNLLIQDGTLKTGQNIVAGGGFGRVRQMKNDRGQVIKSAEPGFPVEMIGLQDLPQAGDSFYQVTDEKAVKELINLRKSQGKVESSPELSSEDILKQMELSENKKPELHVVLKADREGSLEALKNSLESISSDEVDLKIIHAGAGAITESDVLLASAVSGIILGFNIRPDGKAQKTAKEKSVDIYTYSIIYELLDQVKKLLIGLLKAEFIEEDQGKAEVREIFHISKVGTIAGSYVIQGQIPRSAFIRLVRDGRLIHEGRLSSLKRFKEDVKQVGEGFECGISLENFNDIKPKDILEAYIKKEKERTEL